MDNPWFRWSYLFGIRPVHRNGYLAIGGWLLIAVPSAFVATGAAGSSDIARITAAIVFIATNLTFFWVVFLNLSK